MSNKLRQLFKNISEIDPPVVLAGFILSRIEKEKIRKAKRQLIFSYFGLGGSFALAIFAGIFFGQAFLQSEFWSMLSLIFSDIAVVAGNWDTFMQSLLETFPTVYTTILLVPIFTMLISANSYYNSKASYKHKFI